MSMRCYDPDLPQLESITLQPVALFGDTDESRKTMGEIPYDYTNKIVMRSEESW